MRRIETSAIACLVVASIAGCGTAIRRASPSAALFAARCGACHTLTGRMLPSRQGGDLLQLRITAMAMHQFVAEMPVHPPLTARQVRTLSGYVLAVERSAARHQRADGIQRRS